MFYHTNRVNLISICFSVNCIALKSKILTIHISHSDKVAKFPIQCYFSQFLIWENNHLKVCSSHRTGFYAPKQIIWRQFTEQSPIFSIKMYSLTLPSTKEQRSKKRSIAMRYIIHFSLATSWQREKIDWCLHNRLFQLSWPLDNGSHTHSQSEWRWSPSFYRVCSTSHALFLRRYGRTQHHGACSRSFSYFLLRTLHNKPGWVRVWRK